MITGYYDDLEIGQTFESAGRTITESYVLQFAMLSGDWHPLHTDTEYAAGKRFGERIAHGMLTLAVTTGLMTLSTESVEAFYGLDKLRFLRPVLFGDTIRVRTEIAAKEPSPDGGGTIDVAVTVVNQREEAVLVTTMRFVVANRREGAVA